MVYKGLVLTTIPLKGRLEHGETVTFNKKSGNENDFDENATAVFIKDIQEVSPEWWDILGKIFGTVYYRATYVRDDKIKEAFEEASTNKDDRPLFYVHGWAIEPDKLFKEEMKTALEHCQGKGIYPIPVMWPTEFRLNILDWSKPYNTDQDGNAIKAGNAIKKKIVQSMEKSPLDRKSLMCHSMGNHVVFNGALGALGDDSPEATFENIFMVAADVPGDVFADSPMEVEYKDVKEKAQNLSKMVAESGKIYVLHTKKDSALKESKKFNNQTRPQEAWEQGREHVERLGKFGALEPNLPNVVNVDVSNRVNEGPQDGIAGGINWFLQMFIYNPTHNYQWDEWAVKFYSDPTSGLQ